MEIITLELRATGNTYDLSNPEELIVFREDLLKIGFFSYPENKHFWEMFERNPKKREVESLINAIRIYEIKSKRIRQRHAD